jgi:hypothetical protein
VNRWMWGFSYFWYNTQVLDWPLQIKKK